MSEQRAVVTKDRYVAGIAPEVSRRLLSPGHKFFLKATW